MNESNNKTGDFCFATELSYHDLEDYFSDLHNDAELAIYQQNIEYLKQMQKSTLELARKISNCLQNEQA